MLVDWPPPPPRVEAGWRKAADWSGGRRGLEVPRPLGAESKAVECVWNQLLRSKQIVGGAMGDGT